MRTAWLVALVFTLLTARAHAQESPAPVYQRMRSGANSWPGRGGMSQHPPYGVGIGGFYNPYFASPVIVGSWYERPYPHHFDYYRHRWGGTALQPGVDMMPVSDCPCLAEPAPGNELTPDGA